MAPDPGGQGSNAPDDGIPGPAKAESGAPVRLRLYLSLPSPTSLRAQSRLDAILVGLGDSARKISIETVDLAVNPLRGLKDGIIATPTLMLCGGGHTPPPIVGDFSDSGLVREFIEAALASDAGR
jgi:hypothetical protein